MNHYVFLDMFCLNQTDQISIKYYIRKKTLVTEIEDKDKSTSSTIIKWKSRTIF